MGVFIAPFQICLLAAGKGIFAAVDRPNGQISDRCASGRPGRSTGGTMVRSLTFGPVDRAVDRKLFLAANGQIHLGL